MNMNMVTMMPMLQMIRMPPGQRNPVTRNAYDDDDDRDGRRGDDDVADDDEREGEARFVQP